MVFPRLGQLLALTALAVPLTICSPITTTTRPSTSVNTTQLTDSAPSFADTIAFGIALMQLEHPPEQAEPIYLFTERLDPWTIKPELKSPTKLSLHFSIKSARYHHARKDLIGGKWTPTFLYEREPPWAKSSREIPWPPPIDVEYAAKMVGRKGYAMDFLKVSMVWNPSQSKPEWEDTPVWVFEWANGVVALVDMEGIVYNPRSTRYESGNWDDGELLGVSGAGGTIVRDGDGGGNVTAIARRGVW